MKQSSLAVEEELRWFSNHSDCHPHIVESMTMKSYGFMICEFSQSILRTVELQI
jgi:hypothetical protein